THREWEVLRCIMDGLSTQQMADRLGVQRGTVRTHVQNLLTKLSVHSRLQAAAMMTAHASEETWPAHLRCRARSCAPDVETAPASDGSVAASQPRGFRDATEAHPHC